eukprot:gnl/MRDRNA2_/MRDRNA2_87256_c0_seq1.p1 gnl/MRDRNA2_/MRDRNA2_87256_c0~~gnl/MRDRNA2_/MRDRNA2_87256_c0_seq1.p1  ORF type:complete len:261 (+),score=49.96 gnl/MRDRNA2_/MRDRNA2_87256_c0_seq1:89-871(+)
MIALLSVALIASASAGQLAARPSHHKGQFLVKAVQFKHRLRACNAYPYAAPLDVYKNKGEKLTGDNPLPYKTCREFSFPLKAGDKLKFKVGDANAGVFSVSDLPNTDAVLLLVIHRHDTLTNAVSFESHVFAKLLNSQLAIIDTYKGSEKASIRIEDLKSGDDKNKRGEDLHYNTVVAVNPGDYNVVLKGTDGKVKSKASLVAVNKESYVILRVGVEAQQGQSYPQEVVVAPKSEEPKWSGAHSPAPLVLLASMLYLCLQ